MAMHMSTIGDESIRSRIYWMVIKTGPDSKIKDNELEGTYRAQSMTIQVLDHIFFSNRIEP
jgi:hypothetical protein